MSVFFPAQYRRYYTRPPGDGNLRIDGIGIDERVGWGTVDSSGGLGNYLCLILRPAPGLSVRIAGENRTVDETAAVVFRPNRELHYGAVSEWAHCWIGFSGAAIPALLENNGIAVEMPFPCDYERVCRRLKTLAEEIEFDAAIPAAILGSLFGNLLYEIVHPPNDRKIPDGLRRARELLERRALTRTPKVALLARAAGWSASHFSSEFRRVYGASPAAYAQRIRLDEAARLLNTTRWNVGDIAERLGFRDIYYFSRLFKKKFGLPPGEFRKTL